VFFSGFPSIAAAEPTYLFSLTPIVAPEGGATRAWAVNEAGVVVGEVETAAGVVQAFIWSRDGGFRALGTLGGLNSRALDITDRGMVVGESDTSNGTVRAFVWTEANGMRPLPVIDQTVYSTAYAANEKGQIVGGLEDHLGVHAVLWENGSVKLLPRLPGEGPVQPLDISRNGDVVGQIQTGSDDEIAGRAFYFPGAVTAKNLSDFRFISSFGGSAAVAINDRDTTAGYTMMDSSRVRAFRYQPGGAFTLLDDHDAMYSNARDLNDGGDVVGSCIPSYLADEVACAWIDDRWFDLNEVTDTGADWWLVQATAINRSRVITGYALHGETHRAFVLTPEADVSPAGWPVLELDVRDLTETDQQDRSLILSLTIRHDADVRRVVFYENGVVIGTADTEPYEWGWQGRIDGEVEFYAEVVDTSGRRLRSPREVIADGLRK
jgi:probable HAF family extracellular repeat protein